MKKLLLSGAAFLLLYCGTSYAQLTGTLTIPGTYPTLNAAINDLNAQGVGAGGVTLNMTVAETAPAGGYVITATGTTANQITINGNANTLTASASHTVAALNDAIIKIIGGDYITISNFTLQENGANAAMTPGSNTMTEWAIALLYSSATNGAQFNTIIGNTISLNRAYSNSWGIYSNTRHSATSATVTSDITSAAGSNSNNKVWTNQISNVNMGIAFIGSNAAAFQDVSNDVGGPLSLTGNTITNWGGAAAASSYVSNTGTSYCIFMNHQQGLNVSNNTITSAAVTPTVTFRGIVQDYTATAPTGTFTNNINNNTITMTSAQTSGTFRAIDATTGATTATLNINGNSIQNCALTAATTSAFNGILSAGTLNVLSISNNIFRGNTTATTSGGFTGIQSSSAVATSATISNNQIGTVLGDAITFSAATSGSVQVILNSGGAAGSTVTISNNDIRGIVHTVAASATHTYISNTAVNANTNINSNTFTNMSVATSGGITFISNSVTHLAGTVHNVNNNSIVTAFNKTVGGGTVLFYNSFSTSLTAVSEINTGNNFSNMTFTGSTTINGWRCGDGSTTAPYGPNKTVTNNTFSNITAGTSSIQVLEVDYSNSNSTTNTISGNVISNITGAGAVTGIISAQGNQNFSNNTVSGLTSTNGGLVLGFTFTNGAVQNITANKIYNLQSSGAAASVYGIRVVSGVTTNIFHNLIGDLRTPDVSAVNNLIGVNITGGTTINMYHNTIYLNATSTGTDFGSSGIFASATPTLDLRNNLIVNTSTQNGTGNTVAYRRTSASLASYASTSNNNSFYAGSPAAARLIFFDGTNGDQTIAAFRARVATRDAASVSANPPFASVVGSSPLFLHIPAATVTPLESGGMTIAMLTTDYDNDVRPGPVGSVNGGALAPDIGADEFDGILTCMGMPVAGTPSISAPVCGTGTFTLTLTGSPATDGITYQWQESSVSNGPYTPVVVSTTSTYTTSAVSTTTYYVAVVTCTHSGMSATTSEVTGIVNPLPTVAANTSANVVCDGDAVTLSGSGANMYTWTGNVTDNVAFTPSVTDTYTVTGTDGNGCTNTDDVTITVNPLPNVVANTTVSAVCDGNPVTLSGSGATTYTWTGNVTDNVAFIPAATGTYTVTGTDGNGCTNTDAISISVNPLPAVVANTSATVVCSGNAVTLSGSGANTYTWTGNVMDNIPFNLPATGSYTVTGTDVLGCTNTDEVTVTVNLLPNVVANTSANVVCAGDAVTLSGNGANMYTWTGNVTDNVAFNPTVTDTYTVTGTDGNGCTNTDNITVTVNPLPVVTVSFPMDTVCFNGGMVTLAGESPSGGTWSGTGVSGNSFDPQVAGLGFEQVMYSYTDGNSCTATLTDSLFVDVCNALNGIAANELLLQVYPNPNNGSFILAGNAQAATLQIEIRDAEGRLIFQSNENISAYGFTRTIALDVANGIYFMRVISGDEIFVEKIAVQR